jgi:hypothetical protein
MGSEGMGSAAMTNTYIDALIRSQRDLEDGWALISVEELGMFVIATYQKPLLSEGLSSELKYRVLNDEVEQLSWTWAVPRKTPLRDGLPRVPFRQSNIDLHDIIGIGSLLGMPIIDVTGKKEDSQ